MTELEANVCLWHKADFPAAVNDVRFRAQSGHRADLLRMSAFDYFRTANLTSYDGLPLGQAKGFYAFASPENWRCIVQRIAAACSAILISAAVAAQAQTPSPGSTGFEKKNYNYSEWTKGLFSEVVTVTHPGKMIFLAGVGAGDESGARGSIRHPGDFAGQCSYAYDKIKRLLAMHGATMNDVVKVVTYVTDVRNLPEAGKCRTEALAGAPQPVHTFLNINQLAWPGMLVEVDVIAITKEP